MRTLAVLGLGSNVGDTRAILRSAVRELSAVLGGLRVSSVYRTAPQDYADQDDFSNLVVAGWWDGSPFDLLDRVHRIEAGHGRDREREIPKGPRPLDIDIELFGDTVLREAGLELPHPRLRMRQFVLVPLLELLPDCAEPVSGVLYRNILQALPDQGVRMAGDLYGN